MEPREKWTYSKKWDLIGKVQNALIDLIKYELKAPAPDQGEIQNYRDALQLSQNWAEAVWVMVVAEEEAKG